MLSKFRWASLKRLVPKLQQAEMTWIEKEKDRHDWNINMASSSSRRSCFTSFSTSSSSSSRESPQKRVCEEKGSTRNILTEFGMEFNDKQSELKEIFAKLFTEDGDFSKIVHELWESIATARIFSDNASDSSYLKTLKMLMTEIKDSLNFSLDNFNDLFKVDPSNIRKEKLDIFLEEINLNLKRLKEQNEQMNLKRLEEQIQHDEVTQHMQREKPSSFYS